MTQTIAPAASLTGQYELDPSHTRIGFTARHAMVTKVRGQFKEFSGTAHLDFEHPENSRAQLTIEVASIDTGNEQRDGHLRTNDFFDAPTYPTISFTSTEVRRMSDEEVVLVGDLTIKDVTQRMELTFEYTGSAKDPYGNTRVGFEGKGSLNRKEFGIAFNAALETGGVLVSEKIGLEFDVSAIRSEAPIA